MSHKLKIYILNGDGEKAPFPSEKYQIAFEDFSAKFGRMGSAPEITANIEHPSDIDSKWTYGVFVEFRGERFFLKNLPKHTKNNTSKRYEYALTFVSERSVLDGKYMIDAVQADSSIDGYQSNSTKVVFMGDIHEFAKRLSSAMAYSGLDYSVVVDDGISTEPVLVSFDDKMISAAIAEGFNLYKIPYYFVGKVCHFGYFEHDFKTPLSYGLGNGLLSTGETNSGQRIVNRITGRGSSDNIPFFYPNNSPKGNIEIVLGANNQGVKKASIKNYRKFSEKASDGEIFTWKSRSRSLEAFRTQYRVNSASNYFIDYTTPQFPLKEKVERGGIFQVRIYFTVFGNNELNNVTIKPQITVFADNYSDPYRYPSSANLHNGHAHNVIGTENQLNLLQTLKDENGHIYYEAHDIPPGTYVLTASFDVGGYEIDRIYSYVELSDYQYDSPDGFSSGEELYSPEELGIDISEPPVFGDTISMRVVNKIPFSPNLMPPIYRESLGEERFYDAKNNTYEKPDGSGIFYEFLNEYSKERPSEYIDNNDKEKPSIKGMVNSNGLRIDMFSEFAYDLDDNDDTITSSEGSDDFVHPYFYGKLRKFDGEFGFNLFDHAIENDEMVIEMTSGVCGACKFTIAVDENTQRNLVMVDEQTGELLRDDDGRVVMAKDSQGLDSQNDTKNNEVWIALKKDISTYGQIMPNVEYSHYPSVEDTFVLLHIDLPEAYIRSAEKRLMEYLIESMAKRNVDSYTPSLMFSRIFLRKNEEYRDNLNENSRLYVSRSGKSEHLFVSSISYKYSKKELLPEIAVELQREFVNITSNVSGVVNAVKEGIIAEVYGSDIINSKFLRKDVPDVSYNKPTFKMGLSFDGTLSTEDYKKGNFGKGGAFYKDGNGDTVFEADRIIIRKKAEFNELVVNQTTFKLGSTVFSSAGCKITSVEELDSAYRCYYDNKNGYSRSCFEVGDQARCQRYSPSYKGLIKYYWRVVLGVGDDYVDLAKDGEVEGLPLVDGFDSPEVGDDIAQFGNRVDIDRQSAIVIDPQNGGSVEVYSGINSFDLNGRNYVGMGVNPTTNRAFLYGYGDMFFGDRSLKNQFITYQIPEGGTSPELRIKANIEMGSGSTGLSNLSEFKQIQSEVEDIKTDTSKEYVLWFEDAEPTLDNYPAVDWTNDSIRAKHKEDLYFSDSLGRAWRFEYDSENSSYVWKEITDERTIAALNMAQNALDKANGLEAKLPDIDFLKGVFPDAILVTHGAVLGKLIGVLGLDNAVKAGIYGGGDSFLDSLGYKDTENGTLMIFAGADDVYSAKNAKFRVYENGDVFANRGVFGGIFKKSPTIITPENIEKYSLEYSHEYIAGSMASGTIGGWQTKATLDLTKCGCLVILNSGEWGTFEPYITLPAILDYGEYDESGEWVSDVIKTPVEGYTYEDYLGLLGADIILVNRSGRDVFGCGTSCIKLLNGSVTRFKCTQRFTPTDAVGVGVRRFGVDWEIEQGIGIEI